MRGVINDLRNCCSGNRCSSFFLGFTVGSASTSSITLFFNTLTTIPGVDYLDCPTLSSLRIDDGNGHVYNSNTTDNFSLISASTDSGGVTFDISAATLDDTLPWTITVNGCIINDAGSCSKTVSLVNAPITPTTTTTTTAAFCKLYTVLISEVDLGNASDGNVYTLFDQCETSGPIVRLHNTVTSFNICVKPGTIPTLYYFGSGGYTICDGSNSKATTLGVECGL
jgi:hypothetical protein